jgi:hypothetical protein
MVLEFCGGLNWVGLCSAQLPDVMLSLPKIGSSDRRMRLGLAKEGVNDQDKASSI